MGKPACFPHHGSHAHLFCGRWPQDGVRKTAREGKKWVLQRGPRPVHRGPFGFHEHLSGFCCEPSLGPQVLTRSGSGVCVCACLLGGFSRVQLFETPWVITCQSPLIMGSSRQECWSGLPCPPPGDLPHPGMEPASLMSPALAGGSGEG